MQITVFLTLHQGYFFFKLRKEKESEHLDMNFAHCSLQDLGVAVVD